MRLTLKQSGLHKDKDVGRQRSWDARVLYLSGLFRKTEPIIASFGWLVEIGSCKIMEIDKFKICVVGG